MCPQPKRLRAFFVGKCCSSKYMYLDNHIKPYIIPFRHKGGVWKVENILYYGDNLKILRNELIDESVDLIYLDPPFNSNRDYNQIFTQNGQQSKAQIMVFEDTWGWNDDVEKLYFETVRNSGNDQVSRFLVSIRQLLQNNNMMAYITMMAPRLIELHRVMKKTGNLFLHCDPSASHYLKLLLDAIFGFKNFRNEIAWCYRQGGRGKKTFAKKHDTIFFYTKSGNYTFNVDEVRIPYHGKGGFQTSGNGVSNPNGKQYLPNPKGKIPEDWWDISALPPMSKERVGYPTQKPLTLLKRIISSCSNEGDVVLDPFCGCGTAIVAAENLNRRWIGIDITHIAITTIKERLDKEFGIHLKPNKVTGEPYDLDGAKDLANRDRFEFQKWALNSLLGIKNTMKKGADGGIDGVYYYEDGLQIRKCIAQVKSGKVSVRDVRELQGVVNREKVELGLLITLQSPSKNMIQEAASFGIYERSNGKQYPIIQIIQVEELINHSKFLHTILPE